MSAIVVNPDRFIAERYRGRPLTPESVRRKLKEAGLSPRLARARKPELPRVSRIEYEQWAKEANQLQWTQLLVRMVSGEAR